MEAHNAHVVVLVGAAAKTRDVIDDGLEMVTDVERRLRSDANFSDIGKAVRMRWEQIPECEAHVARADDRSSSLEVECAEHRDAPEPVAAAAE